MKGPGPQSFTAEFYTKFRKDQCCYLSNFNKIEKEIILPKSKVFGVQMTWNSFLEANITLIPNIEKDSMNQELQPNLPNKHTSKILNKKLAKRKQQTITKFTHHDKVRLILWMQSWFSAHRSINVIYSIKRTKDKNHITSKETEKGIWHSPTPMHGKKNPTEN